LIRVGGRVVIGVGGFHPRARVLPGERFWKG